MIVHNSSPYDRGTLRFALKKSILIYDYESQMHIQSDSKYFGFLIHAANLRDQSARRDLQNRL